jgi:hypothetical protein
MSLADELAVEVPQKPKCGTCTWYDQLSSTDQSEFDNWLSSGKEVTALWRACTRLTENPYLLARCSFAKHVAEHHELS